MKNKLKYFMKGVSYRIWKKLLKKNTKYTRHDSVKILEAGCGSGALILSLKKWYKNSKIIIGDLEINSTVKDKEIIENHKLLQFDAHRLPFADKSFNIIFSLQVLEHLREPEKFISECKRLLTDEGIVILSTPNIESIGAKIMKKRWVGFDVEHISLKSALTWREILLRHDLKIIKDGTTGISGISLFRVFPFNLINYIPLAVFGFFPWYQGESYMVMAQKK
ncbi:MAG: class I SAM-dependent methyltransferase [Spirochaetia bacterium]|nr:class I SAM-dependent methyltransferase [Spirochaetia bacterium]